MHQLVERILFEEWNWGVKLTLGALAIYGLYKHFMYLLDQNQRRQAAMQRQKEFKERKLRDEQALRQEVEAQRLEAEKAQLAELTELRKRVSAMDNIKTQ
jgi:flagellar biosynthesis/type III secretory pathway M-ring protein FliF/YscJ